MQIKVEVVNDEASGALARLSALGADLTPVMRGMAEAMHASVIENFRAQGRPPWAPLAPSTLRKRRQSGQAARILVMTARLRNSITSAYGRDYAAVGTNVVYGPIQHFGGTVNRAARSVLSLRLRTDTKGGLMRNARGGAIFAGRKDRARAQRATVGAHTITIPARPFLVIPPTDMPKLAAVPLAALKAAWRA